MTDAFDSDCSKFFGVMPYAGGANFVSDITFDSLKKTAKGVQRVHNVSRWVVKSCRHEFSE